MTFYRLLSFKASVSLTYGLFGISSIYGLSASLTSSLSGQVSSEVSAAMILLLNTKVSRETGTKASSPTSSLDVLSQIHLS